MLESQDTRSQEKERLLKSERLPLSAQLIHQDGARKTELDDLTREVGFVEGCNFLVPLCPDSAGTVGQQAQT